MPKNLHSSEMGRDCAGSIGNGLTYTICKIWQRIVGDGLKDAIRQRWRRSVGDGLKDDIQNNVDFVRYSFDEDSCSRRWGGICWVWYGGRTDLRFCVCVRKCFGLARVANEFLFYPKERSKSTGKTFEIFSWVRGVDYEKGRCKHPFHLWLSMGS